MTSKSAQPTGLWSRQQPRRTSPKRGVGGFYRTADRDGPAIAGVPLSSTEDTVVAAVRLAYKVAEKQVARSTRIAKRLREAGERAAGPESERKAVDAMEDLAINALQSGLAWWEGSVAEGRCPVKRLMAAEFRLLANLLGSPERRAEQTATTSPSKEETHRPAAADRTTAAAPALQIAHTGARRAVRVTAWEVTGAGAVEPRVLLYNAKAPESEPLTGEIALDGRTVARLTLNIPQTAAPGPWSAAICNPDGVQLGIVEIVL
jgi:hypothetical protein